MENPKNKYLSKKCKDILSPKKEKQPLIGKLNPDKSKGFLSSVCKLGCAMLAVCNVQP